MFEILTNLKWQLISGAAGLAFVTVSGLLGYSYIENRHLVKVNGELSAKIDDFRIRLATETANRATMEAVVERQNGVIAQQAAESAIRLAASAKQLAAAQTATKRAEAQVAVLLSRPPKGDTLAERVADVDARVLESVK